MKTKIRYSAMPGYYVWSVVTSHGTVIAGEVTRLDGGDWYAVVTHDDGTAVRTPHGGRVTGHAGTRRQAVDRALANHVMTDAQRWVALMNT